MAVGKIGGAKEGLGILAYFPQICTQLKIARVAHRIHIDEMPSAQLRERGDAARTRDNHIREIVVRSAPLRHRQETHILLFPIHHIRTARQERHIRIPLRQQLIDLGVAAAVQEQHRPPEQPPETAHHLALIALRTRVVQHRDHRHPQRRLPHLHLVPRNRLHLLEVDLCPLLDAEVEEYTDEHHQYECRKNGSSLHDTPLCCAQCEKHSLCFLLL